MSVWEAVNGTIFVETVPQILQEISTSLKEGNEINKALLEAVTNLTETVNKQQKEIEYLRKTIDRK